MEFLIFFVAFDSILQFFYGANLFGFTMQNLQSNRISGVFQDELILGSFLSKFTLIVAGIGVLKNKLKTTFFLILVAFCGILISGERASLALFTLCIIFIFFCSKQIKKKIIIFTISAISIFILLVLNSVSLKERLIFETYNSFFSLNKTNDKKFNIFSEGHQIIYLSSIKMFRDNPIFGIGPNNYRNKCSEKKYYIKDENFESFKSRNNDGLINHCNTHPHNYYIQLLAETGLTGFSFLILLSIVFIFNLRKITLTKHKYLNINYYNSQVFIFASILLHLWPITSTGNFFGSSVGNFFWFPFGFLFLFKDSKNKFFKNN